MRNEILHFGASLRIFWSYGRIFYIFNFQSLFDPSKLNKFMYGQESRVENYCAELFTWLASETLCSLSHSQIFLWYQLIYLQIKEKIKNQPMN